MSLRDFFAKRVPGISVGEALMALSRGAVLIDVRTEEEYLAGHAPGARPVEPKSLEDDPKQAIFGDDLFADRDAPIVVLCDSGLRSGLVAARLRALGLAADSVTGGLAAWAHEGHPLIPGPYRRRM